MNALVVWISLLSGSWAFIKAADYKLLSRDFRLCHCVLLNCLNGDNIVSSVGMKCAAQV